MQSLSDGTLGSSGFEPLVGSQMARLDGGIPWAYYGYVAGAYAAKTVLDHWGDFKAGVRQGLQEMWYRF